MAFCHLFSDELLNLVNEVFLFKTVSFVMAKKRQWAPNEKGRQLSALRVSRERKREIEELRGFG